MTAKAFPGAGQPGAHGGFFQVQHKGDLADRKIIQVKQGQDQPIIFGKVYKSGVSDSVLETYRNYIRPA